MTEEQKTDQTVQTVEIVKGERGIVGTPTAGLTIKQRYHQAHFARVDADDKHNPTKKMWVKNRHAPSLKEFARKLSASGDATAKDWLEIKKGALNAKRSDANEKAAREAGAASRIERRKKGAGKGGGTTETKSKK